MLRHYSAALDEIYRQRRAAAYEAHIIAGVLAFASLPKGAREQLEDLRERLWLTAKGEHRLYDHVDGDCWQRTMQTAGMRPTLTRTEWEESNG